MSRYTDFYDGVSPSSSDAVFAEKVKASARPHSRGIRRTAPAAIAAAAAAAALTVTVSAAYSWGLGAAVRSFFGDKGNIAAENIVGVNVSGAQNTFDDLDISVKGAVRDGSFAVIFLDIERTDGGVFDCAPFTVTDKDGNDIVMSDGNKEVERPSYSFAHNGKKTVAGVFTDGSGAYAGTSDNMPYTQCIVKDDDDSDGHITQAICIDTGDPFSNGREDLTCDKVMLKLGSFSGRKWYGNYISDGKYITLEPYAIDEMSGSFSCEIDLGSCVTPSRSAVFEGGSIPVKVYTHSEDAEGLAYRSADFTPKELHVTSASVSVSIERESPDETLYVEATDFGSLVMNDGREIAFGRYDLPRIVRERGNIKHLSGIDTGDRWKFSASFILPETVNIDEIAAVKIGDTEIPLE